MQFEEEEEAMSPLKKPPKLSKKGKLLSMISSLLAKSQRFKSNKFWFKKTINLEPTTSLLPRDTTLGNASPKRVRRMPMDKTPLPMNINAIGEFRRSAEKVGCPMICRQSNKTHSPTL